MGSANKQRMTMAKRDRENKLRERRLDKQARKEARKLAAHSDDPGVASDASPEGADTEESREGAREAVEPPADA